MEKFIYKQSAGITALSASFTDFSYKKHCHQEYAFGVTLRGIQQYNLDGNSCLSYEKGVMLFSPEQTHDGRAHDKSGLDYVMVYVEPKIIMDIGKRDVVRFPSPIVYNHSLANNIISLASVILNEKNEILSSELLLSIVETLVPTEIYTVSLKGDNTLIKKAKEMIYCSMERVLKLDEICSELAISKFQFIRLFKANTGISPYQYFLFCKLNHVKKILERNKDVYSAVTECGFVDLSHLNRHFKRVYGVTALEFISHLN
ncbi:Hypothetical protein LUCI_4165 [Lucifera butyrica]|uniref:HTH araC/xylS-type domain-containing protein n=1 Tax=Lucifera butyrica TaxID=1351585 RepID=A0A498RFM3_9FIRM|nr:AraC family transcriptional regulator [Lucifera butyrica]VBB08882.1 Hypothetical protein LUCI_4165 [Lucifera butyrica]